MVLWVHGRLVGHHAAFGVPQILALLVRGSWHAAAADTSAASAERISSAMSVWAVSPQRLSVGVVSTQQCVLPHFAIGFRGSLQENFQFSTAPKKEQGTLSRCLNRQPLCAS